MAYTATPKNPFKTWPSLTGTHTLDEIVELNFNKIAHLKRCIDIMIFLDYHIAENGNSFPSTAQYLHFIFSRKSPFAQKLMTSLLIRAGNFVPSKRAGSKILKEGISFNYYICQPEYEKFVARIYDAIKQNNFDLSKFVPAHHRRSAAQFRRARTTVEEDIKQQAPQQAIDCTFSQDDQFLEIKDETWRKRLCIYYRIFNLELTGMKQFDYKESTFRRFHILQNIKREYQEAFFSRSIFKFEADIHTAAISAVISFTENALEIDGESTFPILFDYMANKQKYRKYLAELFDVDEVKAKKIFAHLINKGVISFSSFSSWRETIADDFAGSKTIKAKKNIWLMQFYEEIKLMWKLAKTACNKNPGLVPFEVTDKNKFDLYFYLERQIIECAEQILEAGNNKYILQHDGWRSEKEPPVKEIEAEIYRKLKLHIKIDIKQPTHHHKL